nr:NAD(P)H-dependent oxidoreductase [Neisseria perflava]
MREQIKQADGVLIVSPEHNRNVPAALKNAIDIASRPAGQSVWGGKPVAIITVSPTMTGGMSANLTMRNSFVVLGAPVMPSPEAYFGSIHKSLNEQGELTGEFVIGAIDGFMTAFAAWIERFR